MRHIALIILLLLTFITDAVAQQDYKLRFYDDSDGLPHNHLTKIVEDRKGMIWIGTWNGLCRYDGNEFRTFKVEPGDGNAVINDRVRDVVLDKDGSLLCRIDEDIFRFDTRTYRFLPVTAVVASKTLAAMERDYETPNAKKHDLTVGSQVLHDVHHEFTDRQGNIWAVGSSGIYQAVPLRSPYSRIAAVEQSDVKAMYRDREGRVWICSKTAVGGSNVAVFDKEMNLQGYLGMDGQLHATRSAFSPVYCVFQDTKGNIWLGSKPDGLLRLTKKGNGFEIRKFRSTDATATRLPFDAVYDIVEDSNGCLWIATLGGGICYVEQPGSTEPRFVSLSKLLGKAYPEDCVKVRRLHLFDKNTMLATTTMGLLVITGVQKRGKAISITRHAREANRASSLSSSATMDIFVDPKGSIAITTESGGINLTDAKSLKQKTIDFRHVTTHDGLGSDAAYSIAALDDYRRIVQCNNQLAVTYAFNDFVCYTREYFKNKLIFSDAAPLKLDNNKVLVALEDGVMMLAHEDFEARTVSPHIALTSIALPEAKTMWAVDHLDTLRMLPNQRNVTIRYAALDYSSLNKKLYSTSFTEDGFMQALHFSEPTTSNEIALYDLNPGTYTLAIRSTDSDGIWCEDSVRTLTIIVEPHFYETTTARLLLLLLIMAIAAGITFTLIYIRTLKTNRRQTLESYLALVERLEQERLEREQAAAEQGTDAEPEPVEEPKEILAPTMSAEDEAFMNRLMDFVEKNIGNSKTTIDDMALATAMSRTSLNRKMHSLLGVTPSDFLREARLKRARQLLLTTNRQAKDIAYSCGFSDPKYFGKCFKASFGVTLTEFREKK